MVRNSLECAQGFTKRLRVAYLGFIVEYLCKLFIWTFDEERSWACIADLKTPKGTIKL